VIARRGARFPERRLRGQAAGDQIPVVQISRLHRIVKAGKAGGMAHQLRHGHVLLTGRGKLRPVMRDLLFKLQRALVRQPQRGERRHRLGGGIDVDDRVLLPGPRLFGIGPAAPQIDHWLAINRGGETGPEIITAREGRGKGAAHGFEFRMHKTLHVTHVTISSGRGDGPTSSRYSFSA
jgi:hypothetical protein